MLGYMENTGRGGNPNDVPCCSKSPLVRDSKQCLKNLLDLVLCVSVGFSSPAKPCLNPLWCEANRLNLTAIISLMISSSLSVFLLPLFFSLESLSYCFICIWSKNKVKSVLFLVRLCWMTGHWGKAVCEPETSWKCDYHNSSSQDE